MDESKGLAYCGLACCVCGENAACAGCKNDGCGDRENCVPRVCCLKKGLKGCWECADFPCDTPMLQKTRVRAFDRYIRRYSEKALLSALGRNERAGIRYHYAGRLVGDYDAPQTEEAVMEMLGRAPDV